MSKLRNINIKNLTPHNLVTYTIGTFALGIFVGFGFGNFEHQRFNLIHQRLEKMRRQISALEKDYIYVNDNYNSSSNKATIIPSCKILNNREFSTFCDQNDYTTTTNKWNTKKNYVKKTQSLSMMSGLDINLASSKNKIISNINFGYDKKSVDYWGTYKTQDDFYPKANIPVCVLSIPGSDYE